MIILWRLSSPVDSFVMCAWQASCWPQRVGARLRSQQMCCTAPQAPAPHMHGGVRHALDGRHSRACHSSRCHCHVRQCGVESQNAPQRVSTTQQPLRWVWWLKGPQSLCALSQAPPGNATEDGQPRLPDAACKQVVMTNAPCKHGIRSSGMPTPLKGA